VGVDSYPKRQLLIPPIAPSLPPTNEFRLSPVETTHTLSLQPHKNPTQTMSDSTHIPLLPTETFQPRPTLRYASAVGIQAAVVGGLVSAVQNALGSHKYGSAGVFTRTGGTIGFFGTSSFSSLFTPPSRFAYIRGLSEIGITLLVGFSECLNSGVNRCYGCYVRFDGIGGG